MKKIILMIAVVALMANKSNAQDSSLDKREQLQFGVKAGVNMSNVYDSKGQEYKADSKIGLAAGVFLAIPIGKYFGIQPELLFSQKGFKASGSVLGSNYEFTHTTNYLDIPILFSVKPSEFFTLQAGPQYSYLMKQKTVLSTALGSGQKESDYDNSNIRKNILCFLGGVQFNLSHFVLNLRAGWDISNNNGDGTSSNPRYKNVWYQATIGVAL